MQSFREPYLGPDFVARNEIMSNLFANGYFGNAVDIF